MRDKKFIVLLLCFVLLHSYVCAQELEGLSNEMISEEMDDHNSTISNTNISPTLVTSDYGYYEYVDVETNHHLLIEDDAELLTPSQIEDLSKEMKRVLAYGNILFKSTNTNSKTPSQYAHDYYYERYQDSSGTVFLIDMANRYLYIHSDGEFYQTITDAKADTITDNVYRFAKNGDYYTCAVRVYQQMAQLFRGQKISEPMKYSSNALISLICGFFISFMFVWSNSRIKGAGASEILKGCKIHFQIGKITAEKTGQRKVYSPVSSSGSSGFSSGGHGSGGGGHSSHGSHSSGGGGGHGF